MFKIMQATFLAAALCLTASVFAQPLCTRNCQNNVIKVRGGGTLASPNPVSVGFDVKVAKVDILAKNGVIVKGSIAVSSEAAGPVDPVTGIDVEVTGTVDAVRVFADHPDVVWAHGFLNAGSFIRVGRDRSTPPGTFLPEFIVGCDGEFLVAFTPWGATTLLTVFEDSDLTATIQDFCDLPEEGTEETPTSLINATAGFSQILLSNGASPGKFFIETPCVDTSVGCPLTNPCDTDL